jgi:hypothetical protein
MKSGALPRDTDHAVWLYCDRRRYIGIYTKGPNVADFDLVIMDRLVIQGTTFTADGAIMAFIN